MLKSLLRKKSVGESPLAHDSFFNTLRKVEYARLSGQGHVYLDYTGGNLYAKSQLVKHHRMLEENVLGNPHSTNPTSQLATRLVKEAREKVIDFFNAKDYHCIFTANATGALKIVGECYLHGPDSRFLLLADNHNSVNGIREYCKQYGGEFSYSPIRYEDLSVDEQDLNRQLAEHGDKENKLFAFPAQSNVSGVKHDLAWVVRAQGEGWHVLLDAAAYVPTSRLDLSVVRPEFVSVSFYKIFGYPTGLGCLLVRKDAFKLLRKRWFAGGTVSLAAVASPHHFLAGDYERFENGTVNYLDIPAVKIGLEHIEQIGMERINERVASLMSYMLGQLNGIRHASGEPVVKVFGPEDWSGMGGTAIMSFLNAQGEVIPFEQVEAWANEKNISIRSGCFCNPGIDEVNNCLTNDELAEYFSSRSTGNYYDMIEYLKKMRGATRVSVGLATTREDLDTFLQLVQEVRGRVA